MGAYVFIDGDSIPAASSGPTVSSKSTVSSRSTVLSKPTGSPVPAVPSGRIERLAAFPSRFVDPRNIDVWLPNGYTPARRYRVLYMHDGQALFSGQSSVSH